MIVWYCAESDKEAFKAAVEIELSKEAEKRVNITYLPNGKPCLENGYISLTDTKDFIAAAYSLFPVGTDAENLEEIDENKLLPLEKAGILSGDKKEKIFSWCEKEACFKVKGEGNLLSYVRSSTKEKYYLKRFELGKICLVVACAKDEEIQIEKLDL